jgi:hypothetical protein
LSIGLPWCFAPNLGLKRNSFFSTCYDTGEILR